MTHLWEVDHPYYCSESNFFAREPTMDTHPTWASFIANYRDADFDLNLVFRFDWYEGEDWGAGEYTGDDYYRNGVLCIFWMCQRKGFFRASQISVCRADEPAVLEFLRPRWGHMKLLWEPLSTTFEAPAAPDPPRSQKQGGQGSTEA